MRLAEFIVKALEAVAAEDEATIDAALYREVIDFAAYCLTSREGVKLG